MTVENPPCACCKGVTTQPLDRDQQLPHPHPQIGGAHAGWGTRWEHCFQQLSELDTPNRIAAVPPLSSAPARRPRAAPSAAGSELCPRAPPALRRRPPPPSMCIHVARQDWLEWDGGGRYVRKFGGAGEGVRRMGSVWGSCWRGDRCQFSPILGMRGTMGELLGTALPI
jgi:hypothetical protein